MSMVATADVVSTRLIDVLPGLSRAGLAKIIVGEVSSRFNGSGAHLRVLNALICHAGTHGDRVWASLKRLASLASLPDDAVSTKTASRAIAAWCKKLGIRKITDPKELLSGPGEHDYLVEGHEKKGEGPVNHYEISALRRFVPAEFLNLWDAFFEQRTIVVATAAPEPPRVVSFEVATVLPRVPRKPQVPPVDTEPVLPLDIETVEANPFSPEDIPVIDDGQGLFDDPVPSPSPLSLSSTLHHPLEELVPAPKMPIEAGEQPLTPPDLCNVQNKQSEINTSEAGILEPIRTSVFDGTNLSPITKREEVSKTAAKSTADNKQTKQPKPNRKPAHKSPLWHVLTADRQGGGRGFDAGGAADLILRFDEAFITKLIEYARWDEGRNGGERGPGWIINTAKNFSGRFPSGFEQYWKAEERRKAREAAEAAEGGNAAARKVYKAAVAEKVVKSIPLPSLDGLPEPLRAIWPTFLETMQQRVSKPTFGTHVRPLHLAQMEGDTIIIFVASEFTRAWLDKRQSEEMAAVLTALLGRPVSVTFKIEMPKQANTD